MHLPTDGTTISTTIIDSTYFDEKTLLIYKNYASTSSYIDIYLLDNSNEISSLLSSNINTSNKTISLNDGFKYLIVANNRSDLDSSLYDNSIGFSSDISYYNTLSITQYHDVSEILDIFTLYNADEYKVYSKNIFVNQSTLDGIVSKNNLIAEMRISTTEMSLYRKKSIVFINRTGNLNTRIKILDRNSVTLYDFTSNDLTTNVELSNVTIDLGRIQIYGLDFTTDVSYDIDFDISIFPFFISQYSVTNFSDKIVFIADTSDTSDIFVYTPELDIILFGGLTSGASVNNIMIFGGLTNGISINEIVVFGGISENTNESNNNMLIFGGIST